MIEGTAAGQGDELETVTRGVTRSHLIVLCCAHSVAELVDEVARNLRGLGFAVEVVCGAEARTALLSRGTGGDEPTIYVVCVQGTLKEQVLKPLRQALATHGGPNQHLFVAVLDLSLPLAMVGQIRRFAEALERPRRKADGLGERRQWREQLGPNTERVATRSYRALEVVGRTDTLPPSGVDTVRRTGPQVVIGSGRAPKIGATDKYRAVTGALPATSGTTETVEDDAASRRRRRAHAPKVRVKPVAGARSHTRAAASVSPAITGDTVVTGAPVASIEGAGANTPSVPMVAAAPAPVVVSRSQRIEAPVLGIDAPSAPAVRSSRPLLLGGLGILAVAGVALWVTGGAGRIAAALRGTPTTVVAAQTTTTLESTPERAPKEAALAATVETPRAASPSAEATAAAAVAPIAPAPIAPAPIAPPAEVDAAEPSAPVEATNEPAEASPAVAIEPPATAPPPADIVPALADAVQARRLRLTDTLYVTNTRSSGSAWQSARAACEAFEIGGVGGFRLPHRRELQALDVLGLLRDEPHWSRTVPDEDPESAYVLHPSTGALTVWFKEESAASVCVRPR